MITFDQAMAAMDAPQITEIETESLDDSDVLNLILQRSEIIRDQEKYNRYIKAWTRGDDAPILDLINRMGRDPSRGHFHLSRVRAAPPYLR
jgi:uncharacterized protein YjaZ